MVVGLPVIQPVVVMVVKVVEVGVLVITPIIMVQVIQTV